MKKRRKILAAAVVAVLAAPAEAVHVDPDGLGQALIFPYYTVRPAGGNAFNTYISVANTTPDAKVVRVRWREGVAGKAALDFNLYLSPNDMWAAAVVPSSDGGATVLSRDHSCTNPPMESGTSPDVTQYRLSNSAYAGDGLGDGIDRVREGHVEMIEVASLTHAAAAAVTQGDGARPNDCPEVQGAFVTLDGDALPPTGGLMGTLTLINVASGEDFTVNAVALAGLSSTPFYRNYNDPYPDFSAAEVTPESSILTGAGVYRLRWSRGVDAVSSVLMSSEVLNEYIRDPGTASQTDWILTFPTRRLYALGEPPFAVVRGEAADDVSLMWHTRDGLTTHPGGACGYGGAWCRPPPALGSSSVLAFAEAEVTTTPVVGSRNVVTQLYGLPDFFESGWARLQFSPDDFSMQSEAGSTGPDPLTGAQVTGRFVLGGLPVTGFMVRTFVNGTLQCAAQSCQGNYGGSFPHRYRRSVTPAP